MEYVVIFEGGENNYSAYAPYLPGCGVVGETLEEVRTLIAEAIEFHIEGLQEARRLFYSLHLHCLLKILQMCSPH
ncbi:type II toxin-antitoxin system HicB family antitoxin [Candidatus Poribacteria bacterium]|nr:type II toxin-antitoxin system HicB family antitoxin [Candidatus Poribacteria bacterium]MYH80435.1 type II toxin-antitoxin system HicB family antitoxin [Candidatus Poribacteria bacterium]MYK93285.1 type II toxin-antitoxin system HicB family antitoxin [Candidatus Poribacteria bacterium]